MYDVEKRSDNLENVAGLARRDTYIAIWSHSKMAALGYVYTLGKQTSCSPECCTDQNATSACFLEVQIPLCILMYGWDPYVSCVKCKKRTNIWWEEEAEEEYENISETW